MELYFSGVAGAKEADMLTKAGVTRWLADPVDLDNLPHEPGHHRVLDSGAYRAFKKGERLDVATYVADAKARIAAGEVAWAIGPDVIGDYVATRKNWREVEALGAAGIVPVYQWGAPWRELDWYAARAEKVCIGGLVPLMREKDKATLKELHRIAPAYPDLHFLGLNWLKALEELMEHAHTCDTSKWLDAARYRHVIFRNTRTGHLSQAPQKVLGLSLSREERCIESAKAMREYLEPSLSQAA